MIQHVVMLSLAADADRRDLDDIMSGLAGLQQTLDGILGFQHGPNIDAEGKSPDHPYGFIVSFENRAALDAYAVAPAHRALGARLVSLCRGGAEGIMVYDIDIKTAG